MKKLLTIILSFFFSLSLFSQGKPETFSKITTPLIFGGVTPSSSLTLRSTATTGTSDFIRFVTGSGSERMRIVNGGNVGIGKTNPAYALDIVGTGFASSTFYAPEIIASSVIQGSKFIPFSSVDMLFATRDATGDWIKFAANQGSGAEYARIGGVNGNIGIGTTAPAAKLHVAGAARITDTLYNPIHVGGTDVSSSLTLQSTSAAGSSDYIAFKTGSGSERMRIASGGYVGIGTTNPLYLLHCNGTGYFAGNVALAGNVTSNINGNARFGNSSTGTSATLSLINKNDVAMFFNNSGNLGIGTTAPTAKLHLTNDMTIGTTKDSITVDTVKGLRLWGGATVWEDLRIDALTTPGGASEPVLTDNFRGVSGMFQRLWQGSTQDDRIFFNIQMPHQWKEGGGFEIHIHTFPWTTPAATDTAVWELSYDWQNINGTFGAGSTVIVKQPLNGVAQWQHKLVELVNLNSVAVGKTLSSVITCRLRRLANSNASDNYTGGMGVLYIDGHYEIDSMGSSQELIK